jgi:hypothetical protein
MKYLLLAGLFFPACIAFSQVEKKVWYNQVTVPASPNAAALGKYGDFSVGKSTGTVDVSIPIVSIEESGISVPVTLSYQSSGLKVQENPSWTGLGWSLSAGGVISRTSRGLPDDQNKGFLKNLTDIPNAYAVSLDLSLPLLQSRVYQRLESLSKNTTDYEPDAYSFNFGGNAGSFFFGNDGNVHCNEHSAIKFDPIFSNGKIVSWRATDENGLIYTFDQVEYTFVNVSGADIPEYISSWYLSKIYNPISGKNVYFDYESYDFYYTSTYSPTRTYEKVGGQWGLVSTDLSASSISHRSTKFLSKIRFPNQEVSFINSASQDGFRKLDKIEWSNKDVKRTFLFNYDYFSSCSTSPDCHRLKLVSFEEYSPENPKRHTFEYNEERSFPKKQSNAQDSWGYYNGATSNRSLIPNIKYGGNTFGNGADRSPSFEHALLSTLSKITYPTKGSSAFVYEANTYKSVKKISDIVEKHPTEFLFETGTSFNAKECKPYSVTLGNSSSTLTRMSSTSSNTPDNEIYYFKYAYNIYISDPNNYDPVKHIGELTIMDATTNTQIKKITIKNLASITDSIPPSKLPYGHTISFNLCAFGSVTTATAQIDLYQYDPDELGNPIARETGGVRIKQISNYDPVSLATTYKTYDYGYGGYYVFFTPIYYSTFVSRRANEFEQLQDIPQLLVYSSPVGGTGASACPVAYEVVKEYQGTYTDNVGMIETTFMKANDLGHIGFPFPPQISQHSIRSRIKQQRYLDKAGNPVRIEKYDYDYKVVGSVKGFKVSRIQNTQTPNAPADYGNEFALENFYIYSNWYPLKSKVVSDFVAGGMVESTTTYQYESPLHPYVTREITNNSKGETITSAFKYPLDYTACQNGCYDQYITTLDGCTSLQTQHSTDVSNCALAYGACYDQFLTCLQSMEEDIDDDCYVAGSLSIPCLGRKQKKWHCATNLSDCSDANYKPCLNELEDQYVLCEKEAFNAYKSCQLSFSDCLLTEYEATPIVLDKSLDLLNLGNWVASPIENISATNGVETSKTSLVYTIEPTEKPLQQAALISYNQAPPVTVLSVKKYDLQGNPTVLQEANGAIKMYIWGHENSYVIAEAQSKEAGQIAFTSFEDISNEGSWTFELNASLEGKTGSKSHILNGRNLTRSGLTSSTRYVVSFWAKGGVPSVTNVVASQDASIDAGDGWHFYKKIISGTSIVTIAGTGSTIIDEVRLYPEGSLMKTFTHSPGLGITSATDFNNLTVYYSYDDMGRLKLVKDADRNITKGLEYHFK